MKKLGRMFLVIILLFLVGTALNISNEAINQLTMQNREAVIGADYNNEEITIYLIGNSYVYLTDKFNDAADFAAYKINKMETLVVDHFIKCYKIFRAVFF